ncbi:MAG TPA: serine--tRNA ligase, partial [Micromonosporaceae bacterium]
MIDLRLLREDPDLVRTSQRARGESESAVDVLLAADEARRATIATYEALRAEQKQLGKRMPTATGVERDELIARTKELAAQVRAAEATVTDAEAALRAAQYAIPNIVAPGVPAGGEDDYRVLREVGDRPDISSPRDHLELGETLDMIDMERGAKVSGSRFYFLKGVGALLELGLRQLAMSHAVDAGFTPMIVPVLVKPESMEGTGFLGEHSSEVYRLEADDLYLVGTS